MSGWLCFFGCLWWWGFEFGEIRRWMGCFCFFCCLVGFVVVVWGVGRRCLFVCLSNMGKGGVVFLGIIVKVVDLFEVMWFK